VRITSITPYPVWAGHRSFLFVAVDTDEGVSGVGESGLTGRELAVIGALDHLKPLVIGQDPMRTEHLWQTLSRGGFFPHDRVIGSALAAIDIALWDIKGKAQGLPVYDLLGGRTRDKVVCYCHLQGGQGVDTEPLVEEARQRVTEGWRFLRWSLPNEGELLHPSRAIEQAVRQFEALREAVGPEVGLCFDGHTRLSPAEAVTLCSAVEPYRPYFIEDAIRAESPQAYRMLRQRTRVPLAAGEQFCSKWEFRELIDGDLIDYARIDVCIAGGLTEARKIAAWCEGHYIDVAVHNPLGPVATAACVHLNLSIPNMAVQEQPTPPGTLLTDVITNQPVWEDGYILAPTAPGLGIELNREAAGEHPFRMAELPHLRREDGSFTNW